MKIIIYPTPVGGIAVVVPAPECGLSIEQVGRKDVPTGTPYKIIDAFDIPGDRAFREAWESDFSTFDGVGE